MADTNRTAVAGTLFALLLVAAGARAEVSFDGSMGPAGPAPSRTSPGFVADYLITYDEGVAEPLRQGERRGGNLFQSLDRLDLAPGERASFQALAGDGTPLTGLERVVARITSRSPTLIEGVLRSEIPGADFFLLNPAGITFRGSDGARLQLDMPAGFTASTADFLRLEDPGAPDGVVFDVLDLETFSLGTGAIESYGFLADGDGGRITFDASQPELASGQRLSRL